MKKFKNIVKTAVVVLATAALAACGGAKEDSAPKSGEQVLKVGTAAEYPPFEKQEGGKIVGFDIDLINAIAEASGLAIDIKHYGWDATLDGVEKGRVDIGASAITITDDRKGKFEFSEPYFQVKQLILVKNDSNVSSFDDLAGKKIGVQSATTSDILVQNKFGKTYEGLKGYEDIPGAVDDLMNGRLDAVIADDFVVKEFIKKIGNQGFKSVSDPSFEAQPDYFGFIVPKGNKELVDKINAGLKQVKDSGKYDEIYKKYFSE